MSSVKVKVFPGMGKNFLFFSFFLQNQVNVTIALF